MTFHTPVMLAQVLENLVIKKEGIYVDCTLGGGGHALKIVEQIYPDGLLIGLDQDIEALEFARKKLKAYQDRVIIVKSNFADLEKVLSSLGFSKVSGIFFDLGVSSYQIETQSRGFSFLKDNLLDMRMDLSNQLNAHYVVNHYSENELWEVFSKYGEERFSRSIARLIVRERKKRPIETTKHLAELITNFYARSKKGRWRIHPATRIFQALRIEVNNELVVLKEALVQAIKLLEAKGRIGVISYHSLEDRVVKNTFREWATSDVIRQYGYGLRKLDKKPLYPTEEEIRKNRRARSARMRFAEKKYLTI
ncbi:MAG: 16S rRNA (cytosine(1402)-N(4))-methyltransferase RsmH [Candidatus Caldatribacteriota bacterium]